VPVLAVRLVPVLVLGSVVRVSASYRSDLTLG